MPTRTGPVGTARCAGHRRRLAWLLGRQLVLVALLAAVVLLSHRTPAQALYRKSEIERVPVERIIANLNQRRRDLPRPLNQTESLRLVGQIARAHALAYAQATEELEVTKHGGEIHEGYGPGPAIPYPARGQPPGRGAKDHLEMALKLYGALLGERPHDLRLRLGYAWCLEEGGDIAAAVEHYRKVAAAAWELEKDIPRLDDARTFYTQEAALRLIERLDPQADAAEIAELERRNAHLDEIGRFYTPIVIPLGDAVAPDDLFDLAAAVPFDLDGSGTARRWRWITPEAAWLVWDPAAEGRIESGLQLFGSVTFWLFWDNGYQALAALDDDGDGHLAGAELRGLALWRDADGDGRSAPGEVRPLADWGIAALSTRHERHPAGFPYSPEGVLLSDGRTRPSYDWILPAAPTLAY